MSRIRFYSLATMVFFCGRLIAGNGPEKGFYCSFEAEGGPVMCGQAEAGAVIGSYGLLSALGYRFSPHLVLCGSAVGASTAALGKNRVTMIPAFIRLRSDFLDRPASPYAEFEIGYSFMLPDGPCSKDAELLEDDSRRTPFENGSREYLPLRGNMDWYGMKGEFARLCLGIGWNISGHRMSAGVSAGVCRAFTGTFLHGGSAGSRPVPFSHIEYLEEPVLAEDGTVAGYRRGDPVLTAGRGNTAALSVSLRLSITL